MKKNKYESPPITQETTWNNAKKWLSIVRFRESGTVIQLQDDCEYRVLEVIHNKEILRAHLGPYFKKYLLAYIPLDEQDLGKTIRKTFFELCLTKRIGTKGTLSDLTTQELVDELARQGYDIGLFVSHVASLLTETNLQPLIDLELLVRTSKNLSVIMFSERDITHPAFNKLGDKCSFLFDHIIYYPLYSETDSRQFLAHYANQWDFSLPEKSVAELIDACGGYLWLLHQAERTLRDNPTMHLSDAFSDTVLLRKLEIIWSKFSPLEQKIIRNVHLGTITEKETLSHEFEYLIKIRAIVKKDNSFILGIPLLSKVLERESRLETVKSVRDHILIGKKDITAMFSRQEKQFLLVLLASKKKILTRDTMATAIWGASWEEKYSDWAIDKLAHRVRAKLLRAGAPRDLFKTIKRKGFMFG